MVTVTVAVAGSATSPPSEPTATLPPRRSSLRWIRWSGLAAIRAGAALAIVRAAVRRREPATPAAPSAARRSYHRATRRARRSVATGSDGGEETGAGGEGEGEGVRRPHGRGRGRVRARRAQVLAQLK